LPSFNRPKDLVDPEAKKDRTPSRVANFDKKLKGETDQKKGRGGGDD